MKQIFARSLISLSLVVGAGSAAAADSVGYGKWTKTEFDDEGKVKK